MYYTVYKITNLVNSKIYVGVHKTLDLNDGYMGSGLLIQRAIAKHGIENFVKEYLAIFDNAEDMFLMESVIVNEQFVTNSDNYNLKLGGCGGFDYINASKKNLYQNHKENSIRHIAKANERLAELRLDPEWVQSYNQKLSNSLKGCEGNFKGKSHSEATKQLIGEKNSISQSGERNSQYGTRWIHNPILKRSKRIGKNEPLPEDWLEGRKIKFV